MSATTGWSIPEQIKAAMTIVWPMDATVMYIPFVWFGPTTQPQVVILPLPLKYLTGPVRQGAA